MRLTRARVAGKDAGFSLLTRVALTPLQEGDGRGQARTAGRLPRVTRQGQGARLEFTPSPAFFVLFSVDTDFFLISMFIFYMRKYFLRREKYWTRRGPWANHQDQIGNILPYSPHMAFLKLFKSFHNYQQSRPQNATERSSGRCLDIPDYQYFTITVLIIFCLYQHMQVYFLGHLRVSYRLDSPLFLSTSWCIS